MIKTLLAGIAALAIAGGSAAGGWFAYQHYQDIDQMCQAWTEDGVLQNGKTPEPVVDQSKAEGESERQSVPSEPVVDQSKAEAYQRYLDSSQEYKDWLNKNMPLSIPMKPAGMP